MDYLKNFPINLTHGIYRLNAKGQPGKRPVAYSPNYEAALKTKEMYETDNPGKKYVVIELKK